MAKPEHIYQPTGDPERVTVVIRGPQGSGKSLLAKAILAAIEADRDVRFKHFVNFNGERRVPIYLVTT